MSSIDGIYNIYQASVVGAFNSLNVLDNANLIQQQSQAIPNYQDQYLQMQQLFTQQQYQNLIQAKDNLNEVTFGKSLNSDDYNFASDTIRSNEQWLNNRIAQVSIKL